MLNLLSKKFFYDNYTQDDVCGMFNIEHLLTVILFFVILVGALYLSRKFTEKGVKRAVFIVMICVTVAEIIKISLRIYKGNGYDSWMPLYYCSLFIYASWFAVCKNKTLQTVGYSYMTMGGIAASVFFTIYPSTSLAILPIWHPGVIHSFFYHLVMSYVGLLLLIKGAFKPKMINAIHYGVFVFVACLVGYIINVNLGTNCMFLHNAFKLPILDDILQKSHAIYMVIVVVAQSVLMFWLNYGIYKLVITLKNKGVNNERL